MPRKGCTIIGGLNGEWTVRSQETISGAPLAPVTHISIKPIDDPWTFAGRWKLQGVVSNVRYVEKAERVELLSRQEGLGRPEATYASLMPIKKTAAWWELTQDERREIFEDKSKHIVANMKYLPAIARQLYHSRDLGEEFDFLTWFEFHPQYEAFFNEMIAAFRETLEWKFVEREIDFRFSRS